MDHLVCSARGKTAVAVDSQQKNNFLYFDNINLLRGFAALSVLVYHVIELYPWRSFPVEGPLVWFRIGWLGVDLFFVISGFLITFTASQLYNQYGGEFYKIYLKRRIGRIAPLYLLTGFFYILFCGIFHLKEPGFYKNIIYHLFFIHNLNSDFHGAINGPNWSLGVEMQFYLLVMITIRFLANMHPGRILLICVLMSWSWRTLVFLTACCDVYREFFLSTQIIGCLDEFGFGIFLCRMVLDERNRFFPLLSIYRNPWFWVAVMVIVTWPTLAIYWRWASYWEYWWMVIFWRTFAGMTFFALLGIMLYLASLIKLNHYIFSPFWYLGEISYGIYLWHLLVIKSLEIGETKLFSAPEFLFWSLFFTLALSSFSWHFVEKPSLKLVR